jgi:eukaryotic-like serine/threonine-protein kinase
MGVVYKARQLRLNRLVALKMILAGAHAGPKELARFRVEAEAVARLQHPHIVQIYEVGEHQGLPYFSLEFCAGGSLDRKLAGAPLPPRDAAHLVATLAGAMHAAHEKGIVHRDLKPANILVTMIDGKPVPKVIDFGVAKATAGKLTDESMSTQFGAVIGTFEYMSPEQAGFSGADIDTRADIYSLGVILYELLTGLRPFDARRLRDAALTEMIRIIQEEEPSKPSTRLSTDDSLPSMAALRQTEPRKLMAILRGELDWVVMKCLEKHRERRYETANGLARDIERYLADEPVEARPPSAGYRFGKFLKRHKGPAIAAGLVLLALLVGIAGTTYGLIRAESQRRKAVAAEKAEAAQRVTATAERDRAIAAESRSRTINEFLTQDLLTQAEPANNAAEDHVTLLEVLDRAAAEVGRRFAGQPELEAALRVTIASTYHGLASWEKAEAQWQSLLDAARKRDPQSAESYEALGELAHILGHRGRFDADVVKMAKSAAEGIGRTKGPDHPYALTSVNHLAAAYRHAGRIPEAIALYERVRDAMIARLGPDHSETLSTLDSLALAYAAAGRVREAIALQERVRDAKIGRLGPDHPSTLTTLGNLAAAYATGGKVREAIALQEQVCDAASARLGADHPDTLTALNNLAEMYRLDGKIREAIARFERVRDATIARLGPDHPNTLTTLNGLAVTYANAGRIPEAIALQERIRDAMIARLGPDHPNTLTALSNLAATYTEAGKVREAITLDERVRDAQVAKLGPDHPDTLRTLNNLGAAYLAAGRNPEAIALLERVRDAEIVKLGPDHPSALKTLDNLGMAYRSAGRNPEAIALLERVRDAWIATLGIDHPDTLRTLGHLALAYRESGKVSEAIALLERVRDDRIAELGPDHLDTLKTLANLAEANVAAGNAREAIGLFERVQDGMVAKLGPDHPDTLKTLGNLAKAYQAAGRNPEAIALLERVRDAMVSRLGPDDPDTLTTLGNLGLAYVSVKRLDRSVPLFEDLLKRLEAKLGREHPKTLMTAANLGVNYKDAGRLAEAIPLLEEAHRASGRLPALRGFGPQLLDAYAKAGQPADAITLRERVRDAAIAELGPDHSDTLTALNDLAVEYWSAKRLDKSVPLFEDALKRQEAKLGRRHPYTLNTAGNLGVNYTDAGRLAEAISLLEEAYRAGGQFPKLRVFGAPLLDAYAKAGRSGEVANLVRELLADARKTAAKDSPQLAGVLAQFGLTLLQVKAHSDAEPLLRECLAIREKTQPDLWNTFTAKSMLGGALLGEKKYAEAEPLLVAGYEGMKRRESTIPPLGQDRLTEALERLVQLYEAIDKSVEAARWRKDLEARKAAEKPPEKKL